MGNEADGRASGSLTSTIRIVTTTTTLNGADGLIKIGETRHKEPLTLNRRAAESDLLIYVNINLVPMDGGHKSVAVGLVRLRIAARPPRTADDSRFRQLHGSGAFGAQSQSVCDSGRSLMSSSTSFTSRLPSTIACTKATWTSCCKNEDDFTAFDRMKFEAMRYTMSKLPRPARRKATALASGAIRNDRLLRGQD